MITPSTIIIAYGSTLDALTGSDQYLEADAVDFALAPAVRSARLSREYGVLADGTIIPPLELDGQFVRIRIQAAADYDADTDLEWLGVIHGTRPRPDGEFENPPGSGAVAVSGIQHYLATGLEYFLRAQAITESWAAGNVYPRVLPFNRATRSRNQTIAGNRGAAANASAIGLPDYYTHSTDGSDEWTALTALVYLLEQFADLTGVAITLAGQYAALDDVTGSWDLEGRTYWDAVNLLVAPSRGFACYLDGAVLTVVTITDVPIGTLPANSNLVTIDLDALTQVTDPEVEYLSAAHYDEILVRGERIRVTATYTANPSLPYAQLARDWTDDDESAYDALTAEARRLPENQHLYARLRLPPDWDGTSNGATVAVAWDEELLAVSGSAPLYVRDATFARTLAQYQETTDQPAPPVILVKDAEADAYRHLDRPRESTRAGIAVRVLDDGPGIQPEPKYPHYLGLNHATPGESDEAAVYDYQTLVATLTLPLDQRLAVRVQGIETTTAPIPRTKVIDVPDHHLWYRPAGTVTGADGDTLVETASPATLRDDSAALAKIAALARAWYGRRRSRLTIPFTEDVILKRLGQVVTSVSSSGSVTAVGTIVSAIIYDLRNRTCRLQTEFRDVAVPELVASRPAPAERARRAAAAADDLANLPAVFGKNADGAAADAAATYPPCASPVALVIVDGSGITEGTSLIADVDGRPGMLFGSANVSSVKFRRASDPYGLAWDAAVTVSSVSAGGRHVHGLMIDGKPAAVFSRVGGVDQLYFSRATAADGSAWATPSVVDGVDTSRAKNYPKLIINPSDSIPCIVYARDNGSGASNGYSHDVMIIRADDVSASSWGSPETILAGNHRSAFGVAVIDGRLAVAATVQVSGADGKTVYVRAAADDASAWGTTYEVDAGSNNSGNLAALVETPGDDKFPLVCYQYVSGTSGVYYRVATAVDGSAWGNAGTVNTGLTSAASVSDAWMLVDAATNLPTLRCGSSLMQVCDWSDGLAWFDAVSVPNATAGCNFVQIGNGFGLSGNSGAFAIYKRTGRYQAPVVV